MWCRLLPLREQAYRRPRVPPATGRLVPSSRAPKRSRQRQRAASQFRCSRYGLQLEPLANTAPTRPLPIEQVAAGAHTQRRGALKYLPYISLLAWFRVQLSDALDLATQLSFPAWGALHAGSRTHVPPPLGTEVRSGTNWNNERTPHPQAHTPYADKRRRTLFGDVRSSRSPIRSMRMPAAGYAATAAGYRA